ncbi:pyridoxal 4-dehydrogenase, partial [Paracoccus sp. S4493]
MKTIRIGRTGVEITPIAFGCASIGNLYREVAEEDAQQVLQAAWDAGIRYFDTAPHYGRGLSEQRLGRFLTGRTGAVLSTKVGRVLTPAAAPIPEADSYVRPAQNDVHYDYSGDGIEESLEQSLDRLGVARVDIV